MTETPDTPQVSPGSAGATHEGHTLGPHVVGQRVVVRRVLPGETGPTGGPAMTDTLGECLSWGRGLCEVRTAEGAVVAIHLADIVSGKPVPPRPSVRLRATPREVHLHASALFDDLETAELGEWLVRTGGLAADGRATRRGNSVLACGDPGTSLDEAARRVRDHYAAHDLPALAQVVVGSDEEAALQRLGWVDAGGHAEVMVTSVSRLLRSLPVRPPAGTEPAELTEHGDSAIATIGDVARARVGVDADWVCVGDLWVAEPRRRAGLAVAVLREALDWAASRGATTAHLAVEVDNHAALELYRSLGFAHHHAYRFLALD
ncbi:GNAT family N-acetyltransferase [Nocardioides sp. Y6]|uniref:GNAT family N-acetyltransferase n=1 Tax=Nocardioides malaquae TaxID=2773426 RepID=A0ABR9RQK4_9ACTN|nr:GNAT family N-acetyltransferase [Nocardioides malaquae]MBE7323846.1 GNAT family N-acetyltransferase [Nocardioides malaquae]